MAGRPIDRAAEIWGLVVGIDEYDEPAVRRLTGAAADAVAAVTWLRQLGVPDNQILLHAAPCAATKPAVDAFGLPIRDARWPSLGTSLYGTLRKEESARRLFVFLSGHGVSEPATSHRMFLPQDYGKNGLWKAIDLERLITLLLSTRFERQFLFMDGCQNYPYSQNQRPKIDAGLVSLEDITAAEGTGLVACYAAGQGQYALEIDGRGAMMRPLLELLDYDRLRQLRPEFEREVVNFDWQTGERDLDLKKLLDKYVRSSVSEAAGKQTPPQEQTLIAEARGEAGGDQIWPILRLPKLPTAALRIEVTPAEAISDAVEEIYIWTQRPRHDHYLPVPPATAITVPTQCVVPQKGAVTVECRVREGAGWTVQPAQPVRINPPTAPAQATASFTLQQAPPQPPGPDPLEAYNLRLLRPDGNIDYIFPQIYPGVEASIGPPEGVRLERHEHGPDIFAGTANLVATRQFARGWARAVRRHPLARQYEVVLAPPGRSVQRSRPNLRFDWRETVPQLLAGFLSERKLVFIDRAQAPEQPPPWESGAQGDYSLQELFDLGQIRARPGLARIRIDLPWGRWTESVELTDSEPATIKLPRRIGEPPLRVGLSPNVPATETLIRVHAHGWQYLYRNLEPGASRWMPGERFSRLELKGEPKIGFAQHRERTLIVDLTGGVPRIEPFSATDILEWDLLIGKGRLDALPQETLSGLCSQWAGSDMPAAHDELLGLALGYAAYAARLNQALRAVLRRIAVLGGDDILDWQLLSWFAEGGDRGRRMDRIVSRLEAGEMPLFRWGVSLARDLCDDGIPTLRDTAVRLSLNSVWTCWVPDDSGETARGLKGSRN